MRLVDRIVVSIIIAVQFLFCLLWLLSIPFVFNYGGASAHPGGVLLWIAFWGAGVVAAILLKKKRRSGRIASLLWNLLFVGNVAWRGGVNWQNPSDRFAGYFALFSVFVILYIAATAATGFAARPDVARRREPDS
jgi:hypothetical protein